MSLVIDGYNLLRHTMPPSLAGLDEARLCRLLLASPWAGQPITIVCDGNPKPHAPCSPVAGVELIYSGAGRSADDVIEQMIGADTAPRRLTVVSSDRQVQKAGRRRKCHVLSSGQFISILASLRPADATDRGTSRPEHLSEDEVQMWLKRFGVEEAPEEDDWFF